MATRSLTQRAAAAAAEVAELREELEQLQAAVETAQQALYEVELERDTAIESQAKCKVKLNRVLILLDEARATEAELRVELEQAVAEAATLRRELTQAQATAEIRGKLIDEIIGARAWNRGKAIRRAARVQLLLPRG